MSNYNSLKTTIDANIKQNGRQEITGQILNSVLNQMVTTLGTGYQFAGVATIDTNPGTPDAKVFYIANGKGTYTNFGGINVTEDDVVVLYWDSSWHKVSTGIASQEKLTELESETKVSYIELCKRLSIKTQKDEILDEKQEALLSIDGNLIETSSGFYLHYFDITPGNYYEIVAPAQNYTDAFCVVGLYNNNDFIKPVFISPCAPLQTIGFFAPNNTNKVVVSYNNTQPNVVEFALRDEIYDLVKSIQVEEDLIKPEYLKSNKYIDGIDGGIKTYNGWNMYIIPVVSGGKYSYRPILDTNNDYGFYYLNSDFVAIKAFVADNTLPSLQPLNPEIFPTPNDFGNMEFTIPDGVSYVAFNNYVGRSGNPIFFTGVIFPDTPFIDGINSLPLYARNGIEDEEKATIKLVDATLIKTNFNVFVWPQPVPTTLSPMSGFQDKYYTFITPNFENAGYLHELVFANSATREATFKYCIFKKVYTDNTLSLEIIKTGTKDVIVGQNTISFENDKIWMEPDYLLGINHASLPIVVDYTEWNNGFEWWSEDGKVFEQKLYVNYYYTIDEITYPYRKEESKETFEKLNVVIMGDSITWLGGDDCNGLDTPSKGWTTYFKQKTNPLTIRSYARSGATWSHTSSTKYNITENAGGLTDDNVIYNQINRLISDVENNRQVAPNLIIIAAGTNDAWFPSSRPDALSVDADTEFANTDEYITSQEVSTLTSIAAAMRYDIELIRTNFQDCQIVVLSPLQSASFALSTCRAVGDIIEGCCGYLSANVVRQDKECGIYRAQEKTSYHFTYDGTHTSALGAKMIGYFLAKRIASIIRDNIS